MKESKYHSFYKQSARRAEGGLLELPDTKTGLDDNDTPEAYEAFVRKKVFLNPVVRLVALTDLFMYVVRFAVLDRGPTFPGKMSVQLSLSLAWEFRMLYDMMRIILPFSV